MVPYRRDFLVHSTAFSVLDDQSGKANIFLLLDAVLNPP
jgi:hypothetical protein